MVIRGWTGAMPRAVAHCALAVLLASCGGGGGDPGTQPFGEGAGASIVGGGGTGGTGGTTTGDGARPAADPTVQVSTAAIQGQVIDAGTGSPVSGATVDFGGSSATTDAQGFYSQGTFAATSRLVLQSTATGFESLSVPARVVSGVPAVAVFRVVAQGTASDIVVGGGGTANAADGTGRVTIAANSLESAPGVPAASPVAVRITAQPIGTDPYAVSGDYTSSTGETLEAFGAGIVIAANNAQPSAAAPAVLRLPVSTRLGAPPSSATLYRLDTTNATWVAAGTATLTSVAGGTSYYEGNIDRFGQWLVGAPIAAPVQVTGCVVDDTGAVAANVRIVAEGIAYTGLSTVYTDAAGLFSVPVKGNANILVSGSRGAFLTNAASLSSGTGAAVAPCLTLPSSNAATVRLTWGADPSDIDSHLHVPGGTHVYYVNRGSLTAEPFASLDVDDVTGFGPEVTTIRRPKAGIYRFYLHNFSQDLSPGMTGSPTRVELNYAGRTLVFTPPAGEASNLYWHLFDLEISSNCAMTLYRYNRFRGDEPQNPNAAGATAQFCVP